MVYAILALAVVLEIVGLTALKETDGFTRLVPCLVFAGGLGASFYLEALAPRSLPIGLTYAVWAGPGVVGMVFVGLLEYGERLNPRIAVGMLLVVLGIAAIHVFTPAAEGAPDGLEATRGR